jgi:tetratricopeptide (TPR) repeat protein
LNKFFTTKDIKKIFGFTESQIRYLDKIRLISPSVRGKGGRKYYTFRDLHEFKIIKQLREKGFSLRRVRKEVERVRKLFPEIKNPMVELKVNGEKIFIERGGISLEPSGQLLLHFPQRKSDVKVLSTPCNAIYWYERGCELDTNPSTYDLAIDAYLKAIKIDPNFAEAFVNLGNVYYCKGMREEAEKQYRNAISLNPKLEAANYNLANILLEKDELIDAITHYKAALQVAPDFYDAHFNIALAYEKLNMRERALTHWRAYLKLNPYGEGVRIAQQYLNDEEKS